MQFGVTPPYDEAPSVIVEMAREAEAAGWDGVFVWNEPRTRAGVDGMRQQINQGPPRSQEVAGSHL